MTAKELRKQYDRELEIKPVRVHEKTPISLAALTKVPKIRLQFIVGGGIFLSFDYLIVGGPDDGKRITLYPWRPQRYLDESASQYNGSREEYEREIGYSCRPMIGCLTCGLHAVTVAYITAILEESREHDQSKDWLSALDAERKVLDANVR
jgi:hypothetical protein